MSDRKTFIDLRMLPEAAAQQNLVEQEARKKAGNSTDYDHFQIVNRSIDARRKPVVMQLRVLAWSGSTPPEIALPHREFSAKNNNARVAIIGSGPAGLFAALQLLELGIKPVIFERGKDVRQRRRDLAALNKEHLVNPESNYCFGEGGAGTYSDGKLYTRSKKRGDVKKVLHTLVQFGASSEILVDAHPHIGTNKLPKIIESIRETILASGGEFHFNSKLTDLKILDNAIRGIVINDNDYHQVDYLILATGHSARDIFRLLHKRGVKIEAKPFALGVRVEHPQQLIDQMQYHCQERPEILPPAAYQWATQVNDRGVYSFCMCPGGIIAPCATSPGEIVTNGWSPSKRNNPFANSGVVVSINPEDWKAYDCEGPLAALAFQEKAEKDAWIAGGKTQAAPAQRIVDFLAGKKSESLPECSYQPGIVSADLNQVLPEVVARSLRSGIQAMGKKMPGYLHPDAIMVGVESRTSSPVRIPRNPETLQHLEISGLYPCGEGAGFAGGIVSAAIDGEKCAEKCAAVIEQAAASK